MTVVCGGTPLEAGAVLCPVCGSGSKPMRHETLQSLIKEDRLPHLLEGYSMCLNQNCPVVYFGREIFYKDDVKVKVWFKETDPTVPVCYCKNVSTKDIIDHVRIKNCCHNLRDIQEHTGANSGKECLIKNPAGT
ncbi:BFD-like [2Fe-2S] binding domain-containing protein [Desulforamulus putei DSM 12395]|uniref:BFD-like [2Fe-2S] binding domain-containing protein n=3 Tax=Desulforamulus putei TaxID=74701 RepID=A0A1M4T4K7_9FIRM|nr:BFD-like [2Fe-2S] binding domain-containing protein [Desulforamulus putei DSM 12395]